MVEWLVALEPNANAMLHAWVTWTLAYGGNFEDSIV
jgi:hypothetical protein